MIASTEIAVYSNELQRLLGRLSEAVEGLDEAPLNWKPDVSDANSSYAIAAHIMGNLEAWVFGIACEQPVERDRAGEFASGGPDPAALVEDTLNLSTRIADALEGLPPGALDEERRPSQAHWGLGTPRPVTVREALMETITHAATHLGHLDLTLDIAFRSGRS